MAEIDRDVLANRIIGEIKRHPQAAAFVELAPLRSGMEIQQFNENLRRHATRLLKCDLEIKFAPHPPEGGVKLQIIPVRLTGAYVD